MAPRTKRTKVRERRFLAALTRGVSVAAAAAEAGLSRGFAYKWRADDPEFAARWRDAYEDGTDALEDEARRRAMHGVETPVHYGGKEIGKTRKYSDALLMFLLRGRRPERYRERRTNELTGRAGGPIETLHEPLSDLERAQEILRLLARCGEGEN